MKEEKEQVLKLTEEYYKNIHKLGNDFFEELDAICEKTNLTYVDLDIFSICKIIVDSEINISGNIDILQQKLINQEE